MSRLHRFSQSLFTLLTVTLFVAGAYTPASAGIITTAQLVDAQQLELDRERLHHLLSREDVQKALQNRGVDPIAAQQRVDSMSDTEISTMAARMDQLPAGGRVSTVELLLVIIIIILIV